MQFASRPRETDQKISPSIRAALINSLFEAPAPLFAGIVFAAIAAAMTALKTGNDLVWPCVVLLVVTGAVRAFDLQRYQRAQVHSDRRRGRALEEALPDRRDGPGRCDRHVVLSLHCSSSDDAVAHMICLSVTTGIAAGGAGRAYGRPWIFHLQVLLCFGPTVIALALRGTPYYIAMSLVERRCFFWHSCKSRPICTEFSCRRLSPASARRRWPDSSTPR